MIAALSGTILEFNGKSLIVMTDSGVAYELLGVCGVQNIVTGSKIQVFTYLQVKEDALNLYGFSSLKLRALFQLLITVDGLGPKTAFLIVSSHTYNEIIGAISAKDTKFFQSISGIGGKTASRVILELSGKFGSQASANEILDASPDSELILALQALGYERKTANQMSENIDKSASLEEKIKLALRQNNN